MACSGSKVTVMNNSFLTGSSRSSREDGKRRKKEDKSFLASFLLFFPFPTWNSKETTRVIFSAALWSFRKGNCACPRRWWARRRGKRGPAAAVGAWWSCRRSLLLLPVAASGWDGYSGDRGTWRRARGLKGRGSAWKRNCGRPMSPRPRGRAGNLTGPGRVCRWVRPRRIRHRPFRSRKSRLLSWKTILSANNTNPTKKMSHQIAKFKPIQFKIFFKIKKLSKKPRTRVKNTTLIWNLFFPELSGLVLDLMFLFWLIFFYCTT